ncbi:EpsI family protein [bacterium]|nr:EpsI family protein [bacterium]
MVQFSKRYWIVIGLMAITFAANAWVRAPKTSSEQTIDLRHFPEQIDGWHSEELSIDETLERVLHIDQTLMRNYVGINGERVQLFIGYYQDQKFGAQIHSPQHCLPGSGWTIIRHEKIRFPPDSRHEVNRLYNTKNSESQFVVYWFSSGGSIVESEVGLKTRLLINAIKNQATSVYLCRISLSFVANREKMALHTLSDFMEAAVPSFMEIGVFSD